MTNLNDYVTEKEATQLLNLSPGKGNAWRHLRTHAPHIELVEMFVFTAVRRDDLENYIQGTRKEVGNVGEVHPMEKLTNSKVRRGKTWKHVKGNLGWATGYKKRLTTADVMAIRSEYFTTDVTQNTLAKKHGVSQSTISMIVNRKTWRFE